MIKNVPWSNGTCDVICEQSQDDVSGHILSKKNSGKSWISRWLLLRIKCQKSWKVLMYGTHAVKAMWERKKEWTKERKRKSMETNRGWKAFKSNKTREKILDQKKKWNKKDFPTRFIFLYSSFFQTNFILLIKSNAKIFSINIYVSLLNFCKSHHINFWQPFN